MHFVSFHRGDELIKFQSFFEDSTISRIFLATCVIKRWQNHVDTIVSRYPAAGGLVKTTIKP